MKKMSHPISTFIFVLSLSSLVFSDPTSAITSLVGRNAEQYLAPIGTMLGTDMNSGYFRKGTPHKILGFDITFDMTYAIAPPGETTYDFIIPDDEVDFTIPFQYPNSFLTVPESDLGFIANQADDSDDPTLFKDREFNFILTLDELLDAPDKPAQNIFGCTTPAIECGTTLEVTPGVAMISIKDQIIAETWDQIKDMPGLGAEITYTNDLGVTLTTPAKYDNIDEFEDEFGGEIEASIMTGIETLPDLELPIPPGSADFFPIAPIGLPLPILQGSVGLPFHTEVTFRGLFTPIEIPKFGTIQYGGIGGKIGISEYLSDILYKSENESPSSNIEDMNYILNANPLEIKPPDVAKAISYLRLQDMDVQEIDSLNILFGQGDITAIIDIQNRMRDAQLQLESMPKSKKKKKKKKFPIDLSLGFYTNNFVLDLTSTEELGAGGQAKISSTNQIISLQVGKTFNLPAGFSFIGGIGIYGGIGFESSNLDLSYILANPIGYGCFITSQGESEYTPADPSGDDYTETSCDALSTGSWENDVPTPIALSFPGANKFRSLIGARMRILFLDIYADYNFGASNAINGGIGITFR